MKFIKKEISKKALLIEANKIYQKIMKTFLEGLNYTVDLVETDDEGVNKALDNEYDLIVIDINYSKYAKNKCISLIRESKNVGTTVIAWSKFIDEKNRDLNIIWGADGGLPKKCTVENLKDVIDDCSALQRYERKFLHRRLSIKEKWEQNVNRINLIDEIFHLSDFQVIDLAIALAIIMEYTLSKLEDTLNNPNC